MVRVRALEPARSLYSSLYERSSVLVLRERLSIDNSGP